MIPQNIESGLVEKQKKTNKQKQQKKRKDLGQALEKYYQGTLVIGAVQGQAEPQHLACCM